jgi:hypothetical protein
MSWNQQFPSNQHTINAIKWKEQNKKNGECDMLQSKFGHISLVSDIFFVNSHPNDIVGRWATVPFTLGQQYKTKVRTIDPRGDCCFPLRAPTPNCVLEASTFVKIASKPPPLHNVTFYRSRGDYKTVIMDNAIHDDVALNPEPTRFVLQWRSAACSDETCIYSRLLEERNMARGQTLTYIDVSVFSCSFLI